MKILEGSETSSIGTGICDSLASKEQFESLSDGSIKVVTPNDMTNSKASSAGVGSPESSVSKDFYKEQHGSA